MADIRSAAGEGSERSGEPGVPNRDQPAQELAELIARSGAESDAKGKAFWRRRRRKSTPPPPTVDQTPSSAPDPSAVLEEPATVNESPAASRSTAVSDPAGESAAGSAATPADDNRPPADQAIATPDADESSATDLENPAPSQPESPQQPADARAPADAVAPATAETTPAVPSEAASAAGISSAPEAVAGEGDAGPAADEAVPGEGAPEAAVSVESEPHARAAERPRSTVGVVYEPEESSDGFPFEYGDIIVGLPKQQPAPEKPTAADPTQSADTPSADDAHAEDAEAHPSSDAEQSADIQEPGALNGDQSAPAALRTDFGETEAAEQSESAHADSAEHTDDSAEQRPVDGSDEQVGDLGGQQSSADTDEQSGDAAGHTNESAKQESADDPGDQTAELGEQAAEGAPEQSGESAEGRADDSARGESGEAGEEQAGGAEGEQADELTAEQMAEKLAAEQAAMALITALMKLRGALAASQLPLDVVGADEARQQQKTMLDQLDDYILPRLVQLEAPVLAVVGGSTGAGKSTLVNTLIGKVVSEPGVLRPTTRSPVLIHHPADADWFVGDRVLPGMARTSAENPGGTEDPGQLRLVAADTVPQGLAILDAPDIDSVVEANRDLATQLLGAADLWLFVTTAARYADAVPWDFLQSASDRSTAVAVVLDRAPEDTIDDITGHLAQMLLERGLGDSPLFSIKETVVDSKGMLPPETVASIKDWLIDLAADAEARSAVVRRTLHGAVTAMTKKTPAFAAAVRAQAETLLELRSTAETAYDRAVKDIAKATQDGTLLRGEVLARWQEFVGTGELLKGLQTSVGRLRDKMTSAVVGKPPPTRDLNDAVESGLESLLREHAEAAAERAEESWQSTAAGRQLLAAGDRDLGRMSKDFPAAASRAVRDWQGFVLDLVRKEGADKRSAARILAYGVNGLGLALMVVIFASTAGIPTGAEVGVGAGTAVVGQKLLEAVFGDQAVRSLVAKARDDLDGRVHALMDAEFARYLAVVDQHPVDADVARQLTEAARAVEDCT